VINVALIPQVLLEQLLWFRFFLIQFFILNYRWWNIIIIINANLPSCLQYRLHQYRLHQFKLPFKPFFSLLLQLEQFCYSQTMSILSGNPEKDATALPIVQAFHNGASPPKHARPVLGTRHFGSFFFHVFLFFHFHGHVRKP